jgi:hypothetical protein
MKTREQWNEEISFAEGRADGARAQVRACRDNLRRAREKHEKALKAWESEFPPRTFRENLELEFAADHERKLGLIAKGLPPDYKEPTPTPPSMIDLAAQYSDGGDVNRKGGAGFRRGAYPRSQFGRLTKLPSEQ